MQANYGAGVELMIEIEVNQVVPFREAVINKSAAKAIVRSLDNN
ncbi:hypothetical protein JCM19233_3713 [Vibrio astriarenae]|nr:hypothetical protein JCM19233_3713 [Vibrio sp. C7]